MKLPIELVHNSKPQKFRWKQSIAGRTIIHEGVVPVALEQALIELIILATNKQNYCLKLIKEIEELKKQLTKELPQSKKVEVPTALTPQQQPKKGK